jgi:energy-coupling factor transporter ATP-binding protein EcfA2
MSLKLTGLKVENYKRITLAEVVFDAAKGGVVALMGRNEQGKSSFLDALEALIAGRKAPKQVMPIHKGRDQSRIVATFRQDDGRELIVTRHYKATGSTSIEVRLDGLKIAKADEILSTLYSHVALDPLAFANLGTKEQTQTLLGLIGFDPSALDEEAANVYATRTDVGREVKRLTEQVKAFPPEDAALAATPLVDVGAVQAELEAARLHNGKKADAQNEALRASQGVVDMDQTIEVLESRLAAARERRASLVAEEKSWQEQANATAELPLDGFQEQIRTADETNEAIRTQIRRAHEAGKLANVEAEQKKLTLRLAEIEKEKAAGFAAAKMPIPGLTVEDGEVYLDGTPFSQTSAGGKLRTSTAIAMALNPDLRAIIIRDGSLLDSSNRKIIDDLAKANDFTVLMEIVDESAPAGVVFEDGAIREVRA